MPTLVKPKVRSNVAIKVFVNPNVANSGLEKYGMSIFDGAAQSDELFLREVSPATATKPAVLKAVNGLDETAPEVVRLPEEERKAAIKDIRETISHVYSLLFGGDKVKITDADFWSKCSQLAPTSDFWKNNAEYPQGFKLNLTEAGMYLDMVEPMDILIERAVKAGGYKALVAPSLESAYDWPYPNPPKFYLDKLENTAAIQSEYRKIVNEAKSRLHELRKTNIERLTIIMRNYDPDPTQYKKSTPADIIYTNADRAIDGELWEKNKRMASQRFIDLCDMSAEELNLRAIVKCASKYQYISNKKDSSGDQQIYLTSKMIALGRNTEEVIAYLKNPMNQDILEELKEKVDSELNQ